MRVRIVIEESDDGRIHFQYEGDSKEMLICISGLLAAFVHDGMMTWDWLEEFAQNPPDELIAKMFPTEH